MCNLKPNLAYAQTSVVKYIAHKRGKGDQPPLIRLLSWPLIFYMGQMGSPPI